jgi:hypothetical protein
MCHVRVSLPLLRMPDTQCVSASAAYARHPMFDPTCHMLPPRTLHTLCVCLRGGGGKCVHVCVCVFVCVRVLVCVRARSRAHTHTHTHAYIYPDAFALFIPRTVTSPL